RGVREVRRSPARDICGPGGRRPPLPRIDQRRPGSDRRQFRVAGGTAARGAGALRTTSRAKDCRILRKEAMTNPIRRLLRKWFGVAPARTCHDSRKQRPAKKRFGFRPLLEGLEDRLAPASTYYLVTGLGDSPVDSHGN